MHLGEVRLLPDQYFSLEQTVVLDIEMKEELAG